MADTVSGYVQKATPLPPSLNPQILYSFKAPLRAYKKRSKYVLRFYVAVALLLSIIIYFLGDHILIIPIWSVLFLFYMLTVTPPPIVENRITRFGIETAGITLRWDVLSHFYFSQRFGFTILTIVTQPPYSMHAYLVVPDERVKKDIMKILVEHIVYQERPALGITDKLINVLSHIIPDDEDEEVIPAKIHTPHAPADRLDEVKDTLAQLFRKRAKKSPVPRYGEPSL